MKEVFVVLANESPEPDAELVCYCVCDNRKIAKAVIEKDLAAGEIQPGAIIEPHVIQTEELI